MVLIRTNQVKHLGFDRALAAPKQRPRDGSIPATESVWSQPPGALVERMPSAYPAHSSVIQASPATAAAITTATLAHAAEFYDVQEEAHTQATPLQEGG